MYRCNYCKRYLKNKYENCPSCGSNSFNIISGVNVLIVNKAPIDGYKLNTHNYLDLKKDIIFSQNNIVSLIVFSTFLFMGIIIYLINLYLLGIVLLVVDLIYATYKIIILTNKINGINKKVKYINQLSKNGILIKNLPYKLEKNNEENIIVPREDIYKIVVEYEIETGKKITFKSEPKYYNLLINKSGTVDLLIDPDDYTNYFIDFEIY